MKQKFICNTAHRCAPTEKGCCSHAKEHEQLAQCLGLCKLHDKEVGAKCVPYDEYYGTLMEHFINAA